MDQDQLTQILTKLEERIARIEEYLELTPHAEEAEGEVKVSTAAAVKPRGEDELEFELGQNWFAKVGIVVLALGIAFLLTFPYTDLPPAAPSLFGYVLAGALFLVARLWQKSFDLVSRYLRGAGMVLLSFTTLRLFFFGQEPVLSASSTVGILLLVAVLALNTAVALKRKSPYLFSLALVTGSATALAVGEPWFVLGLLIILCLLVVSVRLQFNWSGVLIFGTAFVYLTHFLWMINNPFLGHSLAFIQSPAVAPYFLLLYGIILAGGSLMRKERGKENVEVNISAFLNGGAAYGAFLIHTLASFESSIVQSHLIASVALLGLAIIFWVREKSRYSTFGYAMLGYMALSVAIIKSFDVPNVFVWLSAQSLIVVATAIWFRSRFIVVANFAIYLSIIIGYVAVTGEETGAVFGFGLVALASARILNWQKDRLELKTELMRNAYLATGFVVFPYAMYHMVPEAYVSLSWVGIAGFYYLMNLIVRAQKYRWMGHITLLVTVLYVVIIGIAQLEPTYRVVSFLVLGTVLLIVSLVFTRMRGRKRGGKGEGETDGD